ncbi:MULTISPECIES: heavy metal response regulator transcription factor [Achromobacter]|uniref:DNA-binding response regulator n=1 Tax=Achromobacter spanius TaxID=217203 RepID=A0A2K8S096_9BURK|nr:MULTISPECIES: heavy metal response regulator transcription factor [Achromobacter]SPT41722.1 Transcriptional activator protein CopR [Achromobacter denitrificans]AUA56022.1 DNA-binding response regulator [Achromobacter spanius]MDH0735452.1 heavy metal response regulator transcription factor [Achromobacter spanius]PPA77565.1 DNA-binding response regulator [Achromobacter spanius]QYJ21305.1 heavy metal response regulator transcription factor [Achromobacter sp. ES-001]
MKILVIEDERKLAETLRRSLTENSYIVDIALDGVSGLQLAYVTQYDLVILDIGLPGLDGFEVLQRIRQHDNVPVMMLSSRTSLEDRVRGLERGADDYLVKPFAMPELLARVFALKRRGLGSGDGTAGRNVLRVADLELDLLRRRVVRGASRIDLTAKEFGLLTYLMRRPGEVLSRLVLAEQVWDMNFNSNTNVVEVAIRRLRAKVDDPFDTKLLHTVRGMGYTIEHREGDQSDKGQDSA